MPSYRKRLWFAAKSILALAILVGVGRQFAKVIQSEDLQAHPLALHWEFLIPAGLLYLGAHALWGTFWVRLLRSQGVRIGFGVGLRAYFVSQYGKYVPGKVWVIWMRVELLKPFGAHPLPVAMTATYETLTSMGAGAILGIILLPYLGVMPEVVSGNLFWFVAMGSLPIGVGLLNKMVVRVARQSRRPDARPLPSPPIGLLLQGLLQGACGWCLLGLSLALTVRAVAPNPPSWTGVEYLGELSAVALSYVAGFVVLVAPGGIGARELVLQKALSWHLDSAGLAVVIALVLRLVWTAAEVVVAGSLYFWKPTPPSPPLAAKEGNHA